MAEAMSRETRVRTRHSWRRWMMARDMAVFLSQVVLVAAVGSIDDLIHAVFGQGNGRLAVENAARIVQFEATHGLWIEPGVQSFFTHAHDFFGMVITSSIPICIFDGIYGLGHVGVTLAFALWMFIYRRPLFSFVRNIFLILNGLAVLTYEVFPLAPPRLAGSLYYDGHPYRFTDTIFGAGKGLHLSFNDFAAMPSLHVGWALIVALTLFWVVRQPLVRFGALLWPVTMMATVIVTGNHYIADSVGAACLLTISVTAAVLLEGRRLHESAFVPTLARIYQLRYRRTVYSERRRMVRSPGFCRSGAV